jgi:dTDP-4-dehydrorhamnose 3,5-epimerase
MEILSTRGVTMNVIETYLKGVKVIEPSVFGDHRGWFMETFNDSKFQEAGLLLKFIQDNHSFSATKGTLRGLHYQLNPKAQTKLVRCTRGAIYDVAVDIRKGSPTFGKWFGIELSAEDKKQLLIPKGFAHGFMTLTDDVEVQYIVDELYAPECDRGISWNDPTIRIEWPIEVIPVLSEKDKAAPLLKDADNNFIYGE